MQIKSDKHLYKPEFKVCVYDNPATIKREVWREGVKIIELDALIANKVNVNEWSAGQITGDKEAMSTKTKNKRKENDNDSL